MKNLLQPICTSYLDNCWKFIFAWWPSMRVKSCWNSPFFLRETLKLNRNIITQYFKSNQLCMWILLISPTVTDKDLPWSQAQCYKYTWIHWILQWPETENKIGISFYLKWITLSISHSSSRVWVVHCKSFKINLLHFIIEHNKKSNRRCNQKDSRHSVM